MLETLSQYVPSMETVKNNALSGVKYLGKHGLGMLHSTSDVAGTMLIGDAAVRAFGQASEEGGFTSVAHSFRNDLSNLTNDTLPASVISTLQLATGFALLHTREITNFVSNTYDKGMGEAFSERSFCKGDVKTYALNKTKQLAGSFFTVMGACTFLGALGSCPKLSFLSVQDCTFCLPTYNKVASLAQEGFGFLGEPVVATVKTLAGIGGYLGGQKLTEMAHHKTTDSSAGPNNSDNKGIKTD